jgi:hypothetical protein
MQEITSNIGVNVVKSTNNSGYTNVPVRRAQLLDRDIYEVDLMCLLKIVDVWTKGNILDHVGYVEFRSINNFGVDASNTVVKLADFFSSHMTGAQVESLFGTGVILNTRDSYINFFNMCPSYTPDYVSQTALKYINETYEYKDNAFVRRRLETI